MAGEFDKREQEHKQRVKKLKARTSKMRLAVVSKYKDLSKEYEGVGKVAPSRVRNEGEVPKVSLNKSTGKKEAYPLHTEIPSNDKSVLQKNIDKKKRKNYKSPENQSMSISLENAKKYASKNPSV
jgi:hypothetical protein